MSKIKVPRQLLLLMLIALCGISGCQAFTEPNAPVSATIIAMAPSYSHPPTPSAIQAEEEDVFAMAWFEQTFSGTYYRLFLKTNDNVDLWRVVWDSGTAGIGHSQLTETEVQEVKTLLEGLRSYSGMVSPDDLMNIYLSFNLTDQTYSTSLNQNCPQELRQILDIVQVAFKREGRIMDDWIPCRP